MRRTLSCRDALRWNGYVPHTGTVLLSGADRRPNQDDAHGNLPSRSRRSPHPRSRALCRVLHRGAGPARGGSRRQPRVPEGLGRAGPPLGDPHRAPTATASSTSPSRRESIDDLEGYETTLERYGCTVERIAAGAELGQGEAIRFDSPDGPHHGDLRHDGEGRQRPAAVQPAADADGPRRHRPAPARPLPADHRERPRRRPLHERGARLPAHRAARHATRATS